jgi:hypothetical protein
MQATPDRGMPVVRQATGRGEQAGSRAGSRQATGHGGSAAVQGAAGTHHPVPGTAMISMPTATGNSRPAAAALPAAGGMPRVGA